MYFILIYGSSFVPGYEYFIDEVYYIACANHPAFGYIDHPPLSPLILAIWQFVFGDSLYSIRILPALAGSVSVFFAGIVTREIGGGKFAQILASAVLFCSPVFAAMASFYSMNAFEPLLAILLLYYTVKMIKESNFRRWLVMGVLMGLGVMNKHTFGLYILALLLALIFSGKWRLIFNRWFVFGGLIAFVIFLPNIIWQMMNGYPSVEFYAIISRYKNVYTPPLQFVAGQIITMSPFTFPVWITGLLFLLLSKKMKEYRFLGVLFLLIICFMLLSGSSRADRTAFVYPGVFFGGALFWEMIINKYKANWVKAVIMFLLFFGLAISIPIFLPYLNYEQEAAYIKFIGYNTETERGNRSLLPQLIADKIGWKEKADMVIRSYESLTYEEQKRTILSATNYGQAGAIEQYGKKYRLPEVVCGHNSYSLWSKKHLDADIVLYLAHKEDLEEVNERFADVKMLDEIFTSPYVTPHENNLVVFKCKEPRFPLDSLRDRGRFYY